MPQPTLQPLAQPPKPEQLCSKCSVIWNETIPTARRERFIPSGSAYEEADRRNTRVLSHHESLAEMQLAALNGCHSCSLFWRCLALLDFETSRELHLPYELIYCLAPHYKPDDGKLSINLGNSERNAYRNEPVWIVPKTNPESWQPERTPESLNAQTTASEDCLRLARRWLNECREKHDSCALQHETIRNRPSRLLDIQRRETELHVKLATELQFEPDELEYLTLSHCWGTGAKPLLTTTTLDSFKNHIPFEELPKTFTDAILITVELGFRYLWIDSLCIIQDSSDDWASESAIMADIYRHCVCMIAATAASSDDQGCFANRPPLGFISLLVQDGDDTLSLGPPDYSDYQDWFTDNRTVRNTLDTRGWCLQETALSPRTIKFGSEFIFWECLEEQASEMEPFMSRVARDFTDLPYKALLQEAMDVYDDNHRRKVVSRAWGRLSMDYTRRKLSYYKDRWVAVSGVAKKLAQECNMKFVAGLAVDDIVRHILWIARKPGKRLNNGAPSWSWISVDSPAFQDYRQTIVQMKVTDIPDSDGDLERRWLIPLADDEEEDQRGDQKGDPEKLSRTRAPTLPITIRAPACRFLWSKMSEGGNELKATDNELVTDHRLLPDAVNNEASAFEVYGLQHSYKRSTSGSKTEWIVDALLVRKVSDDPELWQRAGVGRIHLQSPHQTPAMGVEDFGKKRDFVVI